MAMMPNDLAGLAMARTGGASQGPLLAALMQQRMAGGGMPGALPGGLPGVAGAPGALPPGMVPGRFPLARPMNQAPQLDEATLRALIQRLISSGAGAGPLTAGLPPVRP